MSATSNTVTVPAGVIQPRKVRPLPQIKGPVQARKIEFELNLQRLARRFPVRDER